MYVSSQLAGNMASSLGFNSAFVSSSFGGLLGKDGRKVEEQAKEGRGGRGKRGLMGSWFRWK